MAYFNSSDVHCGGGGVMTSYVYNLTSSYTDQRNEVTIVATSLAMFLLAALLFDLNLLAGAATTLHPTARLVLSVSLTLFLPVTSYLFSEAKNAGPSGDNGDDTELPLRARLILAWMLLVELLRKKVDGRQGPADRAGRVAFLGYLVFFNVHSSGRRAVFGVLWVVAAANLVQRIAIAEFIKRSFAFGKNPQLLTAYIAQMLEQEQERHVRRDEEHDPSRARHGHELLRSCKYAVMGEENLDKEAGPHGYRVDLPKQLADDDHAVVTVGRVWALAESDQLLASDPKLKRLCLSFALFKLLRREFEEMPMTDAETRDCRDLIFKGLCNDGAADREATAAATAMTLFQVIHDELNFLTEYYHSVLPVVLASPFFLLVNYLLFPLVVFGLCLMTVVLCGNGDIAFVFRSIGRDNYAVSFGVLSMTRCLLSKVLTSPSAFFSTLDLSITFLLFLTFLYEEAWELVVFLLSNWLTVNMVCDYTAKPRCRASPLLRGAIRRIQWVRDRMSHRNLRVKQFSVLWFCRFPLTLPTAAVPEEAKHSIMEYLTAYDRDDGATPLSNGKSALERHPQHHSRLSWACETESVAEVILTWHIATSLLEVRCPPQEEGQTLSLSKAATRLSRYCAYLVAFRPELLPDDVDGTGRVYRAMSRELKLELGLKSYYFSSDATRYGKMMSIADRDDTEAATTVVRKGVRLGKTLMDEAAGDEAVVWKLLADVWTEIVVYVAPSKDAEQVRVHGQALAQGGEFLTVIWALVTHTGIDRPAIASSVGGYGH